MNLYEIVGVGRDSSVLEIKRSYYKRALECHPDRCSDPDAKRTFQELSLAYQILSDPTKRSIYDTTGFIEDNGDNVSWKDFMEAAFPKVSLDLLDEFKQVYVGSAEEYEDILAGYTAGNGSLERVIDSVFWGNVEQADRYYSIIQRAISRNIVPKLKLFVPLNTKKKRKIQKREVEEAKEAEAHFNEMVSKNPKVSDLQNYIVSKHKKDMNTLVERLEKKYGKTSKR